MQHIVFDRFDPPCDFQSRVVPLHKKETASGKEVSTNFGAGSFIEFFSKKGTAHTFPFHRDILYFFVVGGGRGQAGTSSRTAPLPLIVLPPVIVTLGGGGNYKYT